MGTGLSSYTLPGVTDSVTVTSVFTASQMAAALDWSKPTVLKKLLDTPATTTAIVRGQRADAWTIEALPLSLREQIAIRATAHGLTLAEYLESSARPWQPKMPLAQFSAVARDKAAKLQRALLPTLTRPDEPAISKGEIERRGLADYKAAFGYSISGKHWREIVKRTCARARWDHDFNRLEIYLDNEAPAQAAAPVASAIRDELRPLHGLITGILQRGQPGAEHKRQILDDAFLLLDSLSSSVGDKPAKRAILDFLCQHAPFLAINPAALRRSFDRLFQRWREAGQTITSLDDARRGRTRGVSLTDDERNILIAYAAKYGGGRDQGWREAIAAGKLRPELVSYYANSPRKMPRKIREQITHYVDDAKTRLHGPRHAILKGPYINRNPDHPANPLASGDVDQCDDMTFVNLVYDEQPDGPPHICQPQLLVWVDERSWLAYNFALLLKPGYSAFNIRNSWTNKCDEHGLPRKCLYLEGSYWQTARVWVGRKDEVTWGETEQGIRRMGLQIRRAMLPRGKIIERVYGKLQNYLQSEPAYVGRNAVTDKYEEVQKQRRLIEAGHAHPGDFGWYSKAQWTQRLGELLVNYNHTPGEGKYLQGTSPQQTYERCFTTPLLKIPEDCRHLLACNKIEAPITANGLTFRYGKRSFIYKDERLGAMRFKQPRCIAWFNPEHPKFCGVTDLNGENPFVVKLETDVPSHDAPAELLRQAYAENAAMERHAKEIYRAVKLTASKQFEQRRFRPVVSDGAAVEINTEFRRQTDALTANERAQSETVRKGAKAYRRLGMTMPSPDRLRPEQPAAAAELQRLLADDGTREGAL